MSRSIHTKLENKVPSRGEAFVFRAKSLVHQIRRSISNQFGDRVRRFSKGNLLADGRIAAESRSPLWTESDQRERFLVAGKIQNLRIAAASLDGVEVPAGEVFSFWKHIGRTNKSRGYVEGRELREGCIIPNVGGGICQLSNALYDAALKSNFEIIERHAHSQIIPGSLAEQGRDATVFWNYVDLRFRSPKPFRIDAALDPTGLTIRFRGESVARQEPVQISRRPLHSPVPNSCATCGVGECHQVVDPKTHKDFGRTAFMVDDLWPEFDEYIRSTRNSDDALFLPIDGRQLRKANYAWTTDGFGDVMQSRYLTAVRSVRSRKLAAQGAARQRNLLGTYRSLAESYARRLSYDILHVVVQQNLLPFLWTAGHLGGRTFDVLMTALPMSDLQDRLDRARSLHPESPTLGDFRADPEIVKAESEALRYAQRIITPHSEIASLFPEKAERLEWKVPAAKSKKPRSGTNPTILFPASTVGRKGCYELREAISGMNIDLLTMGTQIEGPDFWSGFKVEKVNPNSAASADVIVLPAFVEHRPRTLLQFAASGIPVIASSACGIGNVPGVETIEAGNSASLRKALMRILDLRD
jgi:hypothetical protein